ncbi:hypothetical protein TSA1_33885 [Bradyrhizobium nitroreducens]|uniref:Uncharacterized protein n=1 Tax=Bradyrhizobium nitroreducens TaxID=709803 RepID=A0A2M6UKU6_9BRAD|nr:hypothetical protein TSA1_33885 [Bradyrhizobium nitroreducens]TQF42806.1 hypothetical protein UNPF46_04315 [Bradyrhizobium sp. UNPF46]
MTKLDMAFLARWAFVWLGRLQPFAILVVGARREVVAYGAVRRGRALEGSIGHSLTRCDIKSNI